MKARKSKKFPLTAGKMKKTKSRLAAVLYDLLRDHVPFGALEKIVRENEAHEEFFVENPNLISYAEELADRILKRKKEKTNA